MKIRSIVLAILLGLACGHCFSAQDSHSEDQAKNADASRANALIGPNDTITIIALNSEEISKTWRVSAAGDLDLPMVGKIHAAGLTTGQLEQAVKDGLKRFIRDPELTIYVSDFKSQPVTIAGAVHRPGTYQLEGSKTLLAGILLAGGPDAAGPTMIVSRSVDSGPLPLPGAHLDPSGDRNSVELKLNDVLDPTTAASNLELRAHDVVSISMKQKLVYIIGEVSRPGAVELVSQDRVSVIQVLAAAGGLTKVASARNTQIMRVDSQGLYKKVAAIDLKRMMTGKDEDRLLSAGDIVVVPSSSIKAYGQVATMSAIGTGLMIITRF